jgi:hypothetical protein
VEMEPAIADLPLLDFIYFATYLGFICCQSLSVIPCPAIVVVLLTPEAHARASHYYYPAFCPLVAPRILV